MARRPRPLRVVCDCYVSVPTRVTCGATRAHVAFRLHARNVSLRIRRKPRGGFRRHPSRRPRTVEERGGADGARVTRAGSVAILLPHYESTAGRALLRTRREGLNASAYARPGASCRIGDERAEINRTRGHAGAGHDVDDR